MECNIDVFKFCMKVWYKQVILWKGLFMIDIGVGSNGDLSDIV